jgi:serine/threonine protein kinase
MAVEPRTAEEYLLLLTQSGLVAPHQLAAYLENAAGLPEEATLLATRLHEDGVLTRFQARQLLAGKWRGFFLDKYRVLQPIAAGGMGRVLLAEHTVLNRIVALKVLPIKNATDVPTLLRFHREGRAVASLDHPNIVRAYDMGQDREVVYLAMEHIEGESLADLVKRRGPLPVDLASSCVRQAALGLQHAHSNGWVHRDIKPGNLLLTPAGVVKILDLGLARSLLDTSDDLTGIFDAQHILGTLDYLSPEQVRRSSEVDGRSDIYSLGATFFFLLTGRPPFERGIPAQKLMWHLVADVPPIRRLRPEVPEELEAVVQRMLEKDPAQRFQRPIEVAEILTVWAPAGRPERSMRERHPELLGSAASSAGLHSGARRSWLRRHRFVAAGACLALVLLAGALLAGGGYSGLSHHLSSPLSNGSSSAVLTTRQATRKVGRRVTVEMEVRSVGVNGSYSLYFLNSEENHRHGDNFTVVIPRRLVDDKEAGVAELREKYEGRRIEVTGMVELYHSRLQISIVSREQIRVVTAQSDGP